MGLKHKAFKYCFPEFVSAAAIRRRSSDSGVVLMYHEVLPDEINLPAWTVVKESDFRWQMNYLRRHFDIISLDLALERVQSRSSWKKPFAVITFDDGYKGNLQNVFPIMQSMGIPFTVYVSTKTLIDNSLFWFDRIISLLAHSGDIHLKLKEKRDVETFMIPAKASEAVRWQAIQKLLERLKRMSPDERRHCVKRITEKYDKINKTELQMLNINDLQLLASSDLVTIGSHTHGHEMLDQLDDPNIHRTIQNSIHYLMDIIVTKPEHFSFPNGNYDQRVMAQVQEIGFKSAVTTNTGFFSKEKNFYEIPRIGVGRFTTKSHFMAKVSGFLK